MSRVSLEETIILQSHICMIAAARSSIVLLYICVECYWELVFGTSLFTRAKLCYYVFLHFYPNCNE